MAPERNKKRLFVLLLTLTLILPLLAFPVFAATTVSVLDGQITLTGEFDQSVLGNDRGTISEDGGTVIATALTSSLESKTQYTTTVTITNNTATAAKITFDYSLSNGTSFSESTTSDTKIAELDSGASIIMSFKNKSVWGATTATLTLSNFTYQAAAAESDVTFDFANGAVTAEGTAVASGDKISISSANGATLVATPNSGYKFLGWVNGNTNVLLSTDTTYLLKPTEDMTVRAAFGSAATNAWFKVGDYLVDDLNVAVSLGTVVIPVYDGTLPSGNYTIPSGVTLLIPFDSANTICTENPTTDDNAYTAPTVYRTLIMAEGANITVNGAISVSGKVSSKYKYNGMPSGPLGFINMQSGSNITVNSGANLYVWGYIKGSGSVTVNSGGTVHECFQIADYRGGDATSSIVGKDDEYGVFPFNQYYLQNVEVPMTLYAGAMENGFGAVTVTLVGTKSLSVPFIGASNSMFVIGSGYIVKDYMEETGRTKFEVHGGLTITPVTMNMQVAIGQSLTIDTNKYALPIPNHMTISLESGSINMNQSMAFLPGSELYIREGTTCTLGADKNIYVYDWDNWIYNDGANGYAGTSNLPYVKLPYVPGGNGTTGRSKDALVQIDGTVDVSAGSAYVTAGGANIYSTGTGVVTVGSATKTEVYQVITNGTDISSWPEIEIQPAILLNADGTEVDTTEAGTYNYINGFWHKGTCSGGTATCQAKATCSICKQLYGDLGNHTEVIDAAVAPTCTTTGLTEGKHCSVCNTVLVAQEEVEALGHSYDNGEYTKSNDYTKDDYNTFTCTVCGDSYTASLNLLSIYATSVRAGDGLDIFFYVKKTDVENLPNLTAKITRTRCGVADAPKDIPFAEWTEYGTDYLRFSYSGIAAKEMTDEVYLKIYSGDIQVFVVQMESVENYALRALGTEKSELNTALVDMLNYGAAAQESFDYNKTDLANQQLTAEQQAFATQSVSYTSNGMVVPDDLAAASVSAKNKLMLTFYYSTDLAENGYTAHVTYTDHYGNPQTRTISTFRTNTLDGDTVYGVDVTGLAIADGRQLITCVIKDSNGKEISTSVYSVENYIAKTISSTSQAADPVYELLMKFVASAYAYFH